MDSLLLELIKEIDKRVVVNLFRLRCILVFVAFISPRVRSQVSAMPAR